MNNFNYKWNLNFNEKPIILKQILNNKYGKKLSKIKEKLWLKCKKGISFSSVHYKGSYFNSIKLSENKVLPTITSSRGGCMALPNIPYEVNDEVFILASSFPLDYDFLNVDVKYLTGMSVPPVMMAQVAYQVYLQFLKNL